MCRNKQELSGDWSTDSVMKVFVCGGASTKKQIMLCRRKVLTMYTKAELVEVFLDTDDEVFLSSAYNIGKMFDADVVIFIDDWHRYRKCRIVHFIAQQYDLNIEYASSSESRRPTFKKCEIEDIRQFYSEGQTVDEIASFFGATPLAVKDVLKV